MELILASGSPRRAELMRNCGYDFTVIPSTAQESAVSAPTPSELVEELALLKAKSVLASLSTERRRNAVVVGADTVVVLDGHIIGKPRFPKEAEAMLRAERGRVNTVYTGLAIVRTEWVDGREETVSSVASDSASVHFLPLSDAEISAYVATGEPMDKAGAYGIQGISSMFIDRIDGSFYTVVGLPVHILYRELKAVGITPRGLSERDPQY